jgi:hypothetical protein
MQEITFVQTVVLSTTRGLKVMQCDLCYCSDSGDNRPAGDYHFSFIWLEMGAWILVPPDVYEPSGTGV